MCIVSCAISSSSAQSSAQGGSAANQQTPPDPAAAAQINSSYEGQNVTAIEVAGRPQSAASEFEPLFVQKPNAPFSIDNVNRTLAALKGSGKARDVRMQVNAEANGVRILFILEPAVYFGIFQFPGAERFNYGRLAQVANFQAQTPFNATDVDRDRQALITFFQQQGYFQAKVDAEVKVDSANGLANVLFHCQLNQAAKFGELDIVGSSAEETAALNHSLQTFVARTRGAAIRPGRRYHYSTLTKATRYLQSQLEKRGGWERRLRLRARSITPTLIARIFISRWCQDRFPLLRFKVRTYGAGRGRRCCLCTRA